MAAKKFVSTLRFVIEEVAATSWLAARFIAVRLLAVVEPKVELPVVNKLAAVKIPEIVDEPIFNEVAFPFTATKFVRVVDARVEDPVANKLIVLVVDALDVVA